MLLFTSGLKAQIYTQIYFTLVSTCFLYINSFLNHAPNRITAAPQEERYQLEEFSH